MLLLRKLRTLLAGLAAAAALATTLVVFVQQTLPGATPAGPAPEVRRAAAEVAPRPPSADAAAWGLDGAGPCRVEGRAVVLSGTRYTACPAGGAGRQWQDYRARLEVGGLGPDATALVMFRASDDAWAEVAISDARYAVRERVGGRWRELGKGRLKPGWFPDRRVLTVDVTGRSARIKVDDVALPPVTLDARLTHGALGFALAPKGPQEVTFTPLSVTALRPQVAG